MTTTPTPSYAESVRNRAALNKQKPCSIPGCDQHRFALTAYCGKHARANQRNGHPMAPFVSPADLEPSRKEVRELYAANQDHAGLRLAKSLVAKLMADHAAGTGQARIDREFHRLAGAGVSPMSVVIEVAAAMVAIDQRLIEMPSEEAANVVIARAVLQLAPRAPSGKGADDTTDPRNRCSPWRPAPVAVQYIGRTLRALLLDFLQASVKAVQDRRFRQATANAQPFNLDPAGMTDAV
jgi:hypothetical protein